MRSFWSDPYLWVHLSGIAALPIFLELCLLGLATGDPLLPPLLELFLIAAVGVAPVLWMQWQRPFYIFSVVALSVKPEQLADSQRQLLSLFKVQEKNRVPLILATVVLIAVLRQFYLLAPIATPVNPLPEDGRLVGLLVAALAFFGCNLFLQVPLSVARVMLTSESKFAETEPYPTAQIAQDFSIFGLKLNQLLPPIQPELTPVVETVAPAIAEMPPVAEASTVSTFDPATTEIQPSPAIAEPAETQIASVPTEIVSSSEIPESAETEITADELIDEGSSEGTVEAEAASTEDDIW
jgi:hypothetical protein